MCVCGCIKHYFHCLWCFHDRWYLDTIFYKCIQTNSLQLCLRVCFIKMFRLPFCNLLLVEDYYRASDLKQATLAFMIFCRYIPRWRFYMRDLVVHVLLYDVLYFPIRCFKMFIFSIILIQIHLLFAGSIVWIMPVFKFLLWWRNDKCWFLIFFKLSRLLFPQCFTRTS